MRRRGAWVWLAVALIGPARAAEPRAVRDVFVSHSFALSFRAPAGLSYCPLPEGWSGSDHGTVLFLVPPRACEGVGYPSSARGFEPPEVPRIEVYYDNGEGAVTSRCRGVGRVRFLGRVRPLCREDRDGLAVVAVTRRYRDDLLGLVTVALVTPPGRLRGDLPVLRDLAARVRRCREPWVDAAGRRRFTGWGRGCPAAGGAY